SIHSKKKLFKLISGLKDDIESNISEHLNNFIELLVIGSYLNRKMFRLNNLRDDYQKTTDKLFGEINDIDLLPFREKILYEAPIFECLKGNEILMFVFLKAISNFKNREIKENLIKEFVEKFPNRIKSDSRIIKELLKGFGDIGVYRQYVKKYFLKFIKDNANEIGSNPELVKLTFEVIGKKELALSRELLKTLMKKLSKQDGLNIGALEGILGHIDGNVPCNDVSELLDSFLILFNKQIIKGLELECAHYTQPNWKKRKQVFEVLRSIQDLMEYGFKGRSLMHRFIKNFGQYVINEVEYCNIFRIIGKGSEAYQEEMISSVLENCSKQLSIHSKKKLFKLISGLKDESLKASLVFKSYALVEGISLMDILLLKPAGDIKYLELLTTFNGILQLKPTDDSPFPNSVKDIIKQKKATKAGEEKEEAKKASAKKSKNTEKSNKLPAKPKKKKGAPRKKGDIKKLPDKKVISTKLSVEQLERKKFRDQLLKNKRKFKAKKRNEMQRQVNKPKPRRTP
ncbi:hypothetical protein ACFLZV_07495, partial [Candidatus Margulisiibacteriota bacterium]